MAEIGSLTLDAAGVTVTPTGMLKLDNTLDVKAGTLTVAQTIQGAILVADGGTIDYAGGTLDGVTLSGPAPEQILIAGSGASLVFGNVHPDRGQQDPPAKHADHQWAGSVSDPVPRSY